MTYGLIAALSWGVSTLLAAVAARRIGTLRTVVLGEVAGLVGYLTLFFLGHFSLRGVGSTAYLLILAGMIGVGGYLARQVGLVAVTAAVSSAYPVIPLVGGLLIFRERLLPQQVGGAILILAGLVLLGLGS
jgi:drug/metabolite transporter (DMT)-like permease